MQLVLLAAALVNQLVTGDTGTTVVLAGLTVFNAVIGLRQEAKAEESVKALSQMMKTIARVRRDGQAVEIDADELVPGDIVLVEAGNRVPADGRVVLAATLEIEEAALTGESLPVGKSIDPVLGRGRPAGRPDLHGLHEHLGHPRPRRDDRDRRPGMDTEIGHIADMLANTETSKTPLQRQLDSLSKIIASIAGVALVLVVLLGLARGESFDTLFITGVALAVAAIPTGLPAVVTALLSMGTREIARRNAIVKRLPAVETLGSTSAICSDKTGTLTLNKMTAREIVIPGQNRYTVSGEGYSTVGEISHVGGQRLRPRPLPAADGAVRRRRARRRGPDRRPDRGRADRARRQGRARHHRDPGRAPPGRRGAVRLRLQVHGDLPRDDRRRRPPGGALLRQGRPRRADRPRPRRSATPTARWSRSPTTTGTSPSRPTTRSPTPASGSWSSPSATSSPAPSRPATT